MTVTLGFVLIFSLLGVALMRRATMQNETTERRTHSVEAFWIADAGVELARSKLAKPTPELIPEGDPVVDVISLGEGSYYVYSEQDPDCATCIDRWHIRSQSLVHKHGVDGSTLNQRRGIDAIVAAYDISNAIKTHGTVNGSCVPSGSAQIIGGCESHVDFTFETVFNGLSYNDLIAMAAANPIPATHPIYHPPNTVNHLFHLDSPSDPFRVEGVTVMFMEDNYNTLSLNTNDANVYVGPSILIVDTTGYTGNPVPKVNVTGGVGFCGILWVIGHAKITGNADINGAVFIDEISPNDTMVTGNPDVIFNPACVDTAINGFGGTGAPGLIAWKEFSL